MHCAYFPYLLSELNFQINKIRFQKPQVLQLIYNVDKKSTLKLRVVGQFNEYFGGYKKKNDN